jgi:type I restriction enzyme S subunit
MFLRITNVDRDSIELLMNDVMYVDSPEGAERERTRVQPGDVLVSITADVGWSGVARKIHEGANVSQHVALLRPRPDRCRPEWLALALRTASARSQFDAARYGGTKQQLALDDVGDIRIPLPALPEQDRLLMRLRNASQAKALRERLAIQLGLLQEHRDTLIFHAVTGRVEVGG